MKMCITYRCHDCGWRVDVGKQKAKGMDGLRCPKCDGPLFIGEPYKPTDADARADAKPSRARI